MNYAKLKKMRSWRTKGYFFQKGIWLEVKDSDKEYFMLSGRLEFAPAGIKSKNDELDNLNGIISVKGKGNDAIVETKKDEGENVILTEEENIEVLNIRAKYAKKREQQKNEQKDKDKIELAEKKKKILTEKENKNKADKIQDVTNPMYVKDKQKARGVL
jgi:hypothetical protein